MNSSKAKKLLGFDLDLKFWQSIEIEYKYFPFGRKYLWGRKVKSLNETLFKFEQSFWFNLSSEYNKSCNWCHLIRRIMSSKFPSEKLANIISIWLIKSFDSMLSCCLVCLLTILIKVLVLWTLSTGWNLLFPFFRKILLDFWHKN